MATSYRFVGEAPEVFADLSAALDVPGRVDDPNAEGYQQPGELRPGQTFTGPEGLVHARIERQGDDGGWAPTVVAEATEALATPEAPTEPEPRRRARSTAEQES